MNVEKINNALRKVILGIELTKEDKIIIDTLSNIIEKYGSGKNEKEKRI